ncbi:unnamed protein product [Soboliphyme baturini]|uniref:Actin-related protein 2/3 complex subunit 5 n=1 Tax=Soboliphyme baturini TaxID=241478 RepID=A0A183IXT8_9BILA|nr:unnamed protein product [Soboliphyme baturini]
MAKNTRSTAFRKIDVDAYNEDQYKDEDQEQDATTVGPDEEEVTKLLQMNRNVEALKMALKNPPLKTRNQALKDRATQLVVRVLCSFRQADIESAVQSLDKDQIDLIMKYIYKGFEFPQDGSSSVLLAWHDKVYQVGGNGCIVRVLTDRRRL